MIIDRSPVELLNSEPNIFWLWIIADTLLDDDGDDATDLERLRNQLIGALDDAFTLTVEFGVKFVVKLEESKKEMGYRKFSNIRRTKSQDLNVSRLGLQLSLRNMLKPSV